MSTATATPITIGDIYCVTAHPYMRWMVVAVNALPDTTEPEIVLRSTADNSVERIVALSVLLNPLRFQRAGENG